MHFENIEKWKNHLKKISKDKNIDIQDLQQRYVLEEFAIKISKSDYKDRLILKGGFIVSTILGLDTRTTRDIDITIKSTIYNKEELENIINNIINTDSDSLFEYSLIKINETQSDDKYTGHEVFLLAKQSKTEIKFKLDISNNTLIYPDFISYKVASLFSDSTININSYSIENIISEKFETTLDRGEFNGRIRDLIDIYLLFQNNNHLIDSKILKDSIIEVFKDRGTTNNIENYNEIKDTLINSNIFNNNFNKYISKNYSNLDISLIDIFNIFDSLIALISK